MKDRLLTFILCLATISSGICFVGVTRCLQLRISSSNRSSSFETCAYRKTRCISYAKEGDSSSRCIDVVCSRRTSLLTALVPAGLLVTPNDVLADQPIKTAEVTSQKSVPSLTVPLRYEPKLSAYTISYTIGEQQSKFGAIIDTGSPFLMIPQTSCRPGYPWGCYRPEESREAAGLKPTRERFDGNEGWVEWREGSFSFLLDDTSDTITSAELPVLFPKFSSMTFGVLSESLMDGPGGIFLGLVKNTDSWIRPSFLGQSNVSAFSVDLRKGDRMSQTLTLFGELEIPESNTELINESTKKLSYNYVDSLRLKDYIPLTNELNKKYGDPTIHYVAVASSINVNGSTLASSSRQDGKLYVIFDTGCSGMSISPELFDKQYSLARSQKAKNVWDTVKVGFKTASGEEISLNAKRPIATPLASDMPWGKRLNGHLIVLGLSFLDNLKMTIDINSSKIWFEG